MSLDNEQTVNQQQKQKKKKSKDAKKGKSKHAKKKKRRDAKKRKSRDASVSTLPYPADSGIDRQDWDDCVSDEEKWDTFCHRFNISGRDYQNLAVAIRAALEEAERNSRSPANADSIKSRLKILESPSALHVNANAVQDIASLVRSGLLQTAKAAGVHDIVTNLLALLARTGPVNSEQLEFIKKLHEETAQGADVMPRLPEKFSIYCTGSYAPFQGKHEWMDSNLCDKFWATFQGTRRCCFPLRHHGGCDAFRTGLDPKLVPHAYDHLDQSEALRNIEEAYIPTLECGPVGVPWGKRPTELYEIVAAKKGFRRLDCTQVAVDALEKLLGRKLCQIERMILEETFIGLYYFVKEDSRESFLLAPTRHPECLSDFGRAKLCMWDVIANMAPIIVAKVLGIGPHPSMDRLESLSQEFLQMLANAPQCARSKTTKVWTLLQQLVRRPLTEWSASSKGNVSCMPSP